MRKVAPGFQQTSGSKEAVASLRKGHIERLNLRYTQVSRQELRCLPHLAQGWDRVSPSLDTPVTAGHRAGHTAGSAHVVQRCCEQQAELGGLQAWPLVCTFLPPGKVGGMRL